jgi:hypothetical protein
MRFHHIAVVMISVLTLSLPAQARETPPAVYAAQAGKLVDAMPSFSSPAVYEADTDTMLRLPSLKPRVVHIAGDAYKISVEEDSTRLTVLPYGSGAVVLWPRQHGLAHVTVKDAHGRILMSRRVVATEPAQKYVRLDAGGARKIFYCPNQCYETRLAEAGLK